jgi:hypothetical protein
MLNKPQFTAGGKGVPALQKKSIHLLSIAKILKALFTLTLFVTQTME